MPADNLNEPVFAGGGTVATDWAQASGNAQVVVTGTAIAQPLLNIKPGFNIVAGIGAGLKAGAGFRVAAAMEFTDFSRFVARTVDVLVENACQQVTDGLSPNDVTARAL